ncbi:MAG TPA: PIN domain nuclease [Acidimicrobiales bacterium]|nr:PIN domain nuclease [Acidimicrobiales bacterium]
MTLVDTSAWVDYLRATGSPAHRQLRHLLASGAPIHTTNVVIMEVLAGGRDEAHTIQLRRLLSGCQCIASLGLADVEEAAALYRRCRVAGETVRALNDCLIAAVAIRADIAVLHADRDFDVLARHSPLQLSNM